MSKRALTGLYFVKNVSSIFRRSFLFLFFFFGIEKDSINKFSQKLNCGFMDHFVKSYSHVSACDVHVTSEEKFFVSQLSSLFWPFIVAPNLGKALFTSKYIMIFPFEKVWTKKKERRRSMYVGVENRSNNITQWLESFAIGPKKKTLICSQYYY